MISDPIRIYSACMDWNLLSSQFSVNYLLLTNTDLRKNKWTRFILFTILFINLQKI